MDSDRNVLSVGQKPVKVLAQEGFHKINVHFHHKMVILNSFLPHLVVYMVDLAYFINKNNFKIT